jgi:hypothetical protein
MRKRRVEPAGINASGELEALRREHKRLELRRRTLQELKEVGEAAGAAGTDAAVTTTRLGI